MTPARPPLPRWQGVVALMIIATAFAANHVAARLAFEHGATVGTAVLVRSVVTTVTLLTLLIATGASLRLPARLLGRTIVVGLLLSIQSYCLYGAVSRLPVALALLTFNVFPILLAFLSWATGGEAPTRRTLLAMPVILAGLTLALNVFGIGLPATAEPVSTSERLGQLASGIAFALTASVAFSSALLLTSRWLMDMDGRLRASLTMATVAVTMLIVGLATQAIGAGVGANGQPLQVFRLPNAPAGWLGLALLSILYTVAFSVLFALLPRLGAVNNSPIMNFEPIAALVLGALILDQYVLPVQVVGALVVIGGIVYLATGRSR